MMKCPFCKHEVFVSGMKRFETVGEHAGNPNQEVYPLRPALKCSNLNCGIGQRVFWCEQGGLFFGNATREDVEFLVRTRYKSLIGSWEHWNKKRSDFADKIRPFIVGRYKYDKSHKIANFVFRFSEPEFFPITNK